MPVADSCERGDLLDAAIRKLQLVDAVVQCSERAATHDLVEVHQLADVLAAVAAMIEQALDMLDEYEAAASRNGGAL